MTDIGGDRAQTGLQSAPGFLVAEGTEVAAEWSDTVRCDAPIASQLRCNQVPSHWHVVRSIGGNGTATRSDEELE